ncbi:MAG: hypothetical protein ACOH1Y_07040 [Propionicimonas sp.]
MSEQQGLQVDRTRAQTLRVVGLVVFALGAILAGIGTTSTGLFIFFITLVFAGLGLAAVGESQYRKTLG